MRRFTQHGQLVEVVHLTGVVTSRFGLTRLSDDGRKSFSTLCRKLKSVDPANSHTTYRSDRPVKPKVQPVSQWLTCSVWPVMASGVVRNSANRAISVATGTGIARKCVTGLLRRKRL